MNIPDYSFITPLLEDDERILWRGVPGAGKIFRQEDIFLITFCVFGTGFSCFWEFLAVFKVLFPAAASGDGTFLAVGLLFSVVGGAFLTFFLYSLIGRFLYQQYRRRRTLYVITNKKLIRKQLTRIDMLNIQHLPPMHLRSYLNEYGTIFFGDDPDQASSKHRLFTSAEEQQFTLENIPHAQTARRLILSLEEHRYEK